MGRDTLPFSLEEPTLSSLDPGTDWQLMASMVGCVLKHPGIECRVPIPASPPFSPQLTLQPPPMSLPNPPWLSDPVWNTLLSPSPSSTDTQSGGYLS